MGDRGRKGRKWCGGGVKWERRVGSVAGAFPEHVWALLAAYSHVVLVFPVVVVWFLRIRSRVVLLGSCAYMPTLLVPA